MPQLLKENEVSYYLGEKHIYPKAEGGGGSSTLSGLSDVDTTGLQDGQILIYNATTGKWEPDASSSAGIPIVNHGTSDTTYTLPSNELHIWGTVLSLTITLGTPTDNTIVNLYMFEFTSGSTATTLSLPSTITWEKGVAPTIEADTIYEITIQNNRAKFSEFPTT